MKMSRSGSRFRSTGRLLDSGRRLIPNALVEIGRPTRPAATGIVNDNWRAPLDPNFTGADAH